jgi:hypothetical protein
MEPRAGTDAAKGETVGATNDAASGEDQASEKKRGRRGWGSF